MHLLDDSLPRPASARDIEKFKALFEEIPAALALLRGSEFVFEAANQEYLDLIGSREIIGKKLPDVFPGVEEQGFLQILRTVYETGKTHRAREVEVRIGEEPEGEPERRVFLDYTYRRILDDQGAPYGVFVFAIDVTEKVAARSSVQLEQVKLEAVFASVSAALAIVRGPDAVYEKTNASYQSLFIDRPLLGKTLLEALPELKGQKFPDLISHVLATGETYTETEARALLRRTGEGALEERFFDQSYTRITDWAGRPYGVLIQAIDVTERVRSREKLQAEAEKNARLLQFTPTPFFSLTDQWILSYINPAAEEVLGLRSADLIGRTLWDIFPGLAGSRFAAAYMRAMKERVRIVTEDYYPDFDRWYEAWSYPLDRGLAVSFFDITTRKQDELRYKAEKEKLEAIFEGSAAPLVFFRGPELIYEMVNEPYKALVPKRELLGKPLREALPELIGTGFPEIIQRVFDTGVPTVTHEELAPLLNPATGQIEDRFFDSGVSRINDGEGKPYGVFVQATEVTERVLARKRIEEALSARDTFLSIASHELRTPITGMKLQAHMARRALAKAEPNTVPVDRLKKFVDQTDQGLSRMSRLVEDMLDISRIQSGKLLLNPEPTDLVSFVRDVLDRFSEELLRANIEVKVEAPPGEMPVSIDRFRLEQVLTNLITNAIRYAPGAPVAIRMSPVGERFHLEFHDGGPGIATQDRERVFERFERLVSANQVSGLGLGLYIVRQIVEAHGGRIYLAGGSDPGARFVLEFPRAEAAGMQDAR